MAKHKVNNKLWQWFCIVMMFSVFALPVQSAIPDNIDYQGYLTDSGGSPLNGSVNVTFSLYNVDTGGIALWSNTQAVTVSNGLFEVHLGGLSNPFPLGLFDNPLWLGITVETDGEMSPRTAFSSAAFAFKADDAYTLEGMSASNLDQSGHVADTANPHGVTAAQVGAISASDLTTHAGNTSAHHAKTASFTELADQIADSQIPADVTRDTELVGHAANAGAHHSRYSDAEAVSAVQASGDWVSKAGDTMTGALTVNGQVSAAEYLIQGSRILTGHGAGKTYVGVGAGWSTTTGLRNTFVGSGSGYDNASGSDNTFLGNRSGESNLDGSRNTFLGTEVGLSNTSGVSNVFSGFKSGYSNTTGSANVFSGSEAGYANTSGGSNVFSGYRAGQYNSTGSGNTFSGTESGNKNTIGHNNAYLGYQAGYYNTTGNYNTFVGSQAGNTSNTGSNNTFMGYRAGIANNSGSDNTYLGYMSGYSNTTGNRNIFLGYQAGYSETGSDKLYIDNSSTSTPLIWGDFASNYLDINGRLYAKRSVNGTSAIANHAAIIENSSTGTSPDVLALKVGTTGSAGTGINFVTFFNGSNASLGAIEGNGAGSVTFGGAGADYAEYLPRLNKDEKILKGNIVGVFDGKVSKATQGSSRVMVVSSNPIVTGNDPGQDKRAEYSLVAFVGQAEVKIQGKVTAGDYLIPDGNQDGVGVAVSPNAITVEQFALVVGQAWESSDNIEVKNIRALVGLQHANPVINKLAAENRQQAEQLAQLRAELAGVIRQQVVLMQQMQKQQRAYAVKLAQ